MLDMGFQDSLDTIIDKVPKQRQTLLFSATFPDKIASIAKRIMIEPERVQVTATHDNVSIQQYLYKVSESERLTALRLLLQHYRPESVVVFCNTKLETQEVADKLSAQGFCAVALHGDLEQKERDQTLIRFANKSASVLVATDVAARGLDIADLDAVFNYHLAHDAEVHVHRIGRTGRAGGKGLACTLYTENEGYKLARLEEYLGQSIDVQPLPPTRLLDEPAYQGTMATLQIDGGKKQKLRPGDILGALTGENGMDGKQVGKINVFDNRSYVAVKRGVLKVALRKLGKGKLKGRTFRVRSI